MGKAILGEHSITCIRGPVSKMNIIVKNRAGEEFYCQMQKHIFDVVPPTRVIDVFEKNKLTPRKFLKEFLEFVSNTEWNKGQK